MYRSQKPRLVKTRRLVLVVVTIAIVVLLSKTFTVPSRPALSPLFPALKIITIGKGTKLKEASYSEPRRVGKFSLLIDSTNSTDPLTIHEKETNEAYNTGGRTGLEIRTNNTNEDSKKDDNLNKVDDDDIDLGEDEDPGSEFSFDFGDGMILKKTRDPVGRFIKPIGVVNPKSIASREKARERVNGFALISEGIIKSSSGFESEQIKTLVNGLVSSSRALAPLVSYTDSRVKHVLGTDVSDPVMDVTSGVSLSGEQTTEIFSSSRKGATETLLKNDALVSLQIDSATLTNNSTDDGSQLLKKKRVMPPLSISEMNYMLLRNRAAYRSMRPRWSSARDQQILATKAAIKNAPIVKNDRLLYAPAFRNISTFKRSYELMEHTLKVYVYKEGQKPIFHQPLLKGIYASEGWFMKLMETSRRFVVRDPRKAHMFYMPFSSRFLEFALYDPNSHIRKNLEQYLRDYVDMIAAKYPFWNRTGGADHFLAACHDWAPFETRHTMEHTIRALCNADLHLGFQLGKDVSLPETYVRSARNPLRDLGGRPADQRPTLAFFAGNMHGRLRPILLQHWEDKDPDMKILGPMPPGVRSKMTYIHYMKTSKYCICPRGYEVNSPRVVESIFYECVPVIISDNYVPPFFEVLNWEAFAVFVAEEDVPRLNEILMSISTEKYLALQMGVRKVQQHFLWHSKPVKYDLFHMTLHSIWFNRVYNIRTRWITKQRSGKMGS